MLWYESGPGMHVNTQRIIKIIEEVVPLIAFLYKHSQVFHELAKHKMISSCQSQVKFST